MSTTKNDVHTVLQYLNDSIKGLATCSENCEDVQFKKYLDQIRVQRSEYAAQLKSLLVKIGGEPTNDGTLAGPLHRFYIELKTLISKADKDSTKSEILRGDKLLIEAYNNALVDEKNPDINDLLSEQLHSIHQELVSLTNNANLFSAV
jgi:uncharacterized protein (TIGR02284 family)